MSAALRRLVEAAARSDAAARIDPRWRRAAGRLARRVGAWPPGGGGRARSNGRLAFVGPIPPAETGIASYDRAVLDGLRRIGFLDRHRTDVLWPLDLRRPRTVDRYELAIYQLGNNTRFHQRVYDLAWEAPGLVVLHDLALDDLVSGLEVAGDAHALDTMREAASPGRRPSDPDALLHEPLRIPWCAAIARRARGIVVHSDFCRRYLASIGCRTPVFVVPHPVVDDPEAMRHAAPRARELRAPLEARGATTIVVAPGDVNEAKCLPALIEAIASLPDEVHAVIVGRRIPGVDIRSSIAARGIGERVTVHHDVVDEDFRAWLVAADVGVDLRFPHRGEVSGSLEMAMAAGLPTIVSATGTYLDVPEDTVLRVPAGPVDPAALATRIEELRSDPARRDRIGAAARDHVTALGATEATAKGYEEAILATRELVLDPLRPMRERWARSLAEIGVDETLVGEGYGVSYVRALESFERSP
jgi:glycosyltransferase involved in cell wall biosynthesis